MQDIPTLLVKSNLPDALVVALQKIDEIPEKIAFAIDDVMAEQEIAEDALYSTDPEEVKTAVTEIFDEPVIIPDCGA